MFKNLTVGRRIGLGFGVVMVLLAVVTALTFSGVGGVVTSARVRSARGGASPVPGLIG